MFNQTKSFVTFAIFLFTLFACGKSPTLDSSRIGSYISTVHRWNITSIPVCWENPDSNFFRQEKAWVRNAIATTFEFYTNIRFVGWNSCAGMEGARIRIDIRDERPHSPAGASFEDNPTMFLNFTFQKFSPACQATPEECIRSYAVHEFGHAVSLLHEQDRPDSTCTNGQVPQQNAATVGAYDPDSVMNYCANNPGRLTPSDVKGLEAIYGTNDPGVTIYEDEGLDDTRWTLPPGIYLGNRGQLNPIGNDNIDSLLVPPGVTARACEHEGSDGRGAGRCQVYSPGVYAHLGAMGDMISFVEVTPAVSVFEHWQFQGRSWNLKRGKIYIFGRDFENDVISSIAVPPGTAARVCRDYGGGIGANCQVLWQGQYEALDAAWNDQISLIEVY